MKEGIILSAEGLSVGYHKSGKELPVLDNLRFDLKKGELVCLMGPNGVGKSTLIKTLSRAQQPLSGNIQLEGIALADYSHPEFALHVSVVLTDPVNIGNLTVEELVTFGRYPHTGWNLSFTEADKSAVRRAIKQTGIEDIANKRIFELSDGQRQKVMIARALSQNTPVIILDEPTAHLDLNNRVEIINLLKKLARESDKGCINGHPRA